ncbi:MAG: glycosyltransferase [Actinomycetota bacterium]
MITAQDLTVVLPTRNEAANIGTFLASLPEELRLIVIDSSTDDTPRRIAELRPSHTTVILADANIPEARQLGADLTVTPWILFTDADVVLDHDYLDALGRLPLSVDTGGIVGAKDTVGGHEGYHRWFRRGQRLLDWIGIPAATGSNMMVRSAVLREVGGFDPVLSVNEDTELMFRIKRAGYEVPFAPDLAVRSFDHRRLEAGRSWKWLHSLIRGLVLWTRPSSAWVRRSDWGYWRRLAH